MFMSCRPGWVKPGLGSFGKYFGLAATLLICAAPLAAQQPGFVSFDAPGAGTASNQGTFPTVINQSGAVAGIYTDSSGLLHQFLRMPSGTITEFDPPSLTLTQLTGLNVHGEIVGYGFGFSSTLHRSVTRGYLRSGTGAFIRVDAPGAIDTVPFAINDSGLVAGYYDDVTNHGFIRDLDGNYLVLDEPSAGGGSGQGTVPFAINAIGEVTGLYWDTSYVAHGFIRDAQGHYTSFDPPGSKGTFPSSINLSGEVTGRFDNGTGFLESFVRDAAGHMTAFPVLGAFPSTINDKGYVVGQWTRRAAAAIGFLRDPSGNFTPLTVPVPNNSSGVFGINNANQTTGFYADTSGVYHGFVK
jgi:hypothetical protein